ncbi:MAG: tRNA dimethylallyltransferase, partial [Planctomycetota bacterium]
MTPQDLQQPKLIVILGQTATGKTSLGIELAKQFRGEIISADSRQVYRGMDIGTAKVTPEEMQGIPHHLIDVADPNERFSVAQFREMALAAIEDIHARGNLPILVGGTGFYIQSIVDGIVLPEVPANPAFRSELKSRSTEDLYKILTQKDPRRAATIDPQNKVRLVRALEIIDTLGVVPTPEAEPTDLDILQIGLQVPDTILKERIHARNVLRINNGLLEEVQSLHDNGLS